MLVIYDNAGNVYFSGTGKPIPDGIPYLYTEIPVGKYLKEIDTTTTPHQPIFEDYPKSEMEILKEANEQQQADIDFLMLLLE